jgi:hypothetical protein
MTPQEKLDTYVETIIEAIENEHRTIRKDLEYVFTTITESDRLYLAVKGYLYYPNLGRGTIEANWPFTAGTRIDPDVDRALDKVVELWVPPDSSYTIEPKRSIRTLGQQTDAWNDNATVKSLGGELLTNLLTTIDKFPDTPAAADLKRFRTYLETVELTDSPTNATPGLSMHGQGRAFDFVVSRNGNEITSISTTKASIAVWDGPNQWTQRLKDAVTAANAVLGTGRFEGPLKLKKRYEPWHYAFIKN